MTDQLRQRPGDQPLPTEGQQDVQEALIARLKQRRALGIERYGRPLKTFNGRKALQDLLEELLDGANYALQAEMEWEAVQARVSAALAVHVADETGRCVSCLQSSPCETREILTGQQVRPFVVTRTDPVQEVVCSPDAIEYVRTHFQITAVEDERCIPPAPLGQYLGFPVYVDDALPPRTVRLQPSTPNQ
jgi:hypothetical protein